MNEIMLRTKSIPLSVQMASSVYCCLVNTSSDNQSFLILHRKHQIETTCMVYSASENDDNDDYKLCPRVRGHMSTCHTRQPDRFYIRAHNSLQFDEIKCTMFNNYLTLQFIALKMSHILSFHRLYDNAYTRQIQRTYRIPLYDSMMFHLCINMSVQLKQVRSSLPL